MFTTRTDADPVPGRDGVYLMIYRRCSGPFKVVAAMLAAAPAAAIALRSAAGGLLDPACATLSFLGSSFMFCLSMSALTTPPFWSQHPR